MYYLHSLLQKLQAKEAKSEDDIFHLSEEFAEMQQQNEDMATKLKVYDAVKLCYNDAFDFPSTPALQMKIYEVKH